MLCSSVFFFWEGGEKNLHMYKKILKYPFSVRGLPVLRYLKIPINYLLVADPMIS